MSKPRQTIAVIIAFILLLFNSSSCFAFSDINDKKLEEKVSQLSEFKIISGYSDGSFKPNNNITRAEFSKMIVIATNNEFLDYENKPFSDIPDNNWAKIYIGIARYLGIVNGTTATTFEPEANITYEQAVKMVVVALGYNEDAVSKGGYPDGYISVAKELNLLNSVDVNYKDVATRGNIALVISNALEAPYYYLFEIDNEIVRKKAEGILKDVLKDNNQREQEDTQDETVSPTDSHSVG